jgi:tetratricopeptide (TPR) repeat protein
MKRAMLGFGRNASWGAFSLAVNAVASLLIAEKGHVTARRTFDSALRRLRKARAIEAYWFLRNRVRCFLLTSGWTRRAAWERRTMCDVGSAILDVAGDLAANDLIAAARRSEGELRACLRCLDGHPGRGFALLYACQKGSALVVADPHRALALACLVFDEAETLMDANLEIKAATPAPRQTVQAEAKLLESQAQVQLGYAEDSRAAAIAARELFESAGDSGFGLALADYYEGQAAGFARDYTGAERLLKSALKVFAEFGQNHLMGRAEAALGTLFGQKGDAVRSLQYLDHAVQMLDPETDARPLTMVLNNRAQTLARLGRFDEARAGYARALTAARKLDSKAHLFTIKTGLADLDFRRARFDRALVAFNELSREATESGYENEFVITRLYVAECFGRLAQDREMADAIVALREAQKASPFTPSPAFAEMFNCLDKGALETDLVRNVREHLEREQRGERASGPLMRLVS